MDIKVKYVGGLVDLGLVVGDNYIVVEGPDEQGNVTILDQDNEPLWLLSYEVELIQ